jgi:hypothetical protein
MLMLVPPAVAVAGAQCYRVTAEPEEVLTTTLLVLRWMVPTQGQG